MSQCLPSPSQGLCMSWQVLSGCWCRTEGCWVSHSWNILGVPVPSAVACGRGLRWGRGGWPLWVPATADPETHYCQGPLGSLGTPGDRDCSSQLESANPRTLPGTQDILLEECPWLSCQRCIIGNLRIPDTFGGPHIGLVEKPVSHECVLGRGTLLSTDWPQRWSSCPGQQTHSLHGSREM